MKLRFSPTHLLLALVALLVFGNCSKNIYRVLGPGTTSAQVTRLKRLNDSIYALPGPFTRQIYDSATAARRRLLTPAQYQRYRNYTRLGKLLPLRYPPSPPRGYR
ncbi:MAG: hypothetical protein ACRYFX_04975 [Janthinobacterium lividum]